MKKLISCLCLAVILMVASGCSGSTVPVEAGYGVLPAVDNQSVSEYGNYEIRGERISINHNTAPLGFFGNEHTYGLYAFTTPTVGTPRFAVFVVEFPDDPVFRYSDSDIEKHFFDNSKIGLPVVFEPPHYADEGFNVGFHSVRDFFYRSSYGKLDITGDVFSYTMQSPITEYTDMGQIMDEVFDIAGAAHNINWGDFDSNGTGFTDGIFIVIKNFTPIIHGGGVAFSGARFTQNGLDIRNGTALANISFMQGMGNFNQNSGAVHEVVHLFGLHDIDLHAGIPLNPNGPGATTVMNGFATLGDIPGIMKYIFGWVEPIIIAETGGFEVSLRSYSDYPDLLLIHPNGDRGNHNLFVVEYLTGSNNNFGFDENANIHDFYIFPTVRAGGGLRVWRVTMDSGFGERYGLNFEVFVQDGMTHYVGINDIVEPYIYFEAVHPEGEPNHFFYTGDNFSPHTALNTNYPGSFRDSDDGRRFMENLSNSGIYIQDIIIENSLASFRVVIENTP